MHVIIIIIIITESKKKSVLPYPSIVELIFVNCDFSCKNGQYEYPLKGQNQRLVNGWETNVPAVYNGF